MLKEAINPGLGIRKLHSHGVTGKGVRVAIIDQALYLDHPEFAGKIVAYHDLASGERVSMHGPAVTSLLVGTNCGTAPDARVYYVAVRGGVYEEDFVEGLYWIVQQNSKLQGSEKIRVVCVSAAPGERGKPCKESSKRWKDACAHAEAKDILVLDCTSNRGFVHSCWYDLRAPESITRCKHGYPGMDFPIVPSQILAPASVRTTAEQQPNGDFGYQYWGQGGRSWAIPYVAGVLALGWQVHPELKSEQMQELLFKSAYQKKNGARIINPEKFIRLVRGAKANQRGK